MTFKDLVEQRNDELVHSERLGMSYSEMFLRHFMATTSPMTLEELESEEQKLREFSARVARLAEMVDRTSWLNARLERLGVRVKTGAHGDAWRSGEHDYKYKAACQTAFVTPELPDDVLAMLLSSAAFSAQKNMVEKTIDCVMGAPELSWLLVCIGDTPIQFFDDLRPTSDGQYEVRFGSYSVCVPTGLK